MPQSAPFQTNLVKSQAASSWTDMLPTYYPAQFGPEIFGDDVEEFLTKELSLAKLELLLKHLGFAGDIRSPRPLHEQIIVGRTMVITERMDLHLLWSSDRRLFIKPLPCFLLDPSFWGAFLCCQPGCDCPDSSTARDSDKSLLSREKNKDHSRDSSQNETRAPRECPRRRLWMCAMGFLNSYIHLISYQSDFRIAKDNHLLPEELNDTIWKDWRKFASEVFSHRDRKTVHPRFLRAELRLSRLNTLHCLTQMPPFEPYLRHHWDYSSLYRENITLLATATIFVALILTAMQVGLATDRLSQSPSFMAASYGFTVFAILGPFCALGLVAGQGLWNLVRDLIYRYFKRREARGKTGSNEISGRV